MDAIRRAFERCVTAVTLKPSIGRGTAISRTRMREGLVCEIEDGQWKLTADVSQRLGGGETAPNPDADVRRVLDEADAHSPHLHIFTEPQVCRRTVRTLAPQEV